MSISLCAPNVILLYPHRQKLYTIFTINIILYSSFSGSLCFFNPCKGYRYLYHKIYYFTDILTPYIELKEVNFPKLAKKLAKKIATDGDNNHHYQVAYAIHEKTQSEKTHIHFVVNSIDFVTFNKRRLLYSDLKRHESNLNQIVFDYIENELK